MMTSLERDGYAIVGQLFAPASAICLGRQVSASWLYSARWVTRSNRGGMKYVLMAPPVGQAQGAAGAIPINHPNRPKSNRKPPFIRLTTPSARSFSYWRPPKVLKYSSSRPSFSASLPNPSHANKRIRAWPISGPGDS